jgi:hypothetical protein
MLDGRCPKCEAIPEVSGRLGHLPELEQSMGLPLHALHFPHADDCPLADKAAVNKEIVRLCQRFGFQVENVLEGYVEVGSEIAALYSLQLVADDG